MGPHSNDNDTLYYLAELAFEEILGRKLTDDTQPIPEPPTSLCKRAKELWRRYYKPGCNTSILEDFCNAETMRLIYMEKYFEAKQHDDEIEAQHMINEARSYVDAAEYYYNLLRRSIDIANNPAKYHNYVTQLNPEGVIPEITPDMVFAF